jgi:hypothetical protein
MMDEERRGRRMKWGRNPGKRGRKIEWTRGRERGEENVLNFKNVEIIWRFGVICCISSCLVNTCVSSEDKRPFSQFGLPNYRNHWRSRQSELQFYEKGKVFGHVSGGNSNSVAGLCSKSQVRFHLRHQPEWRVVSLAISPKRGLGLSAEIQRWLWYKRKVWWVSVQDL